MSRRAALELSATFLVVIIISIVVLGASLTLFYKAQKNALDWKDAVDQQTESRLKALMTNTDEKFVIYPNQVDLGRGESKIVSIGINNIFNNDTYLMPRVRSINYYSTSTAPGVAQPNSGVWKYQISIASDCINNYVISTFMVGYQCQNTVKALSFYPKSFYIKMPSSAQKGQYVVTIDLKQCASTWGATCTTDYATAQLFITVP